MEHYQDPPDIHQKDQKEVAESGCCQAMGEGEHRVTDSHVLSQAPLVAGHRIRSVTPYSLPLSTFNAVFFTALAVIAEMAVQGAIQVEAFQRQPFVLKLLVRPMAIFMLVSGAWHLQDISAFFLARRRKQSVQESARRGWRLDHPWPAGKLASETDTGGTTELLVLTFVGLLIWSMADALPELHTVMDDITLKWFATMIRVGAFSWGLLCTLLAAAWIRKSTEPRGSLRLSSWPICLGNQAELILSLPPDFRASTCHLRCLREVRALKIAEGHPEILHHELYRTDLAMTQVPNDQRGRRLCVVFPETEELGTSLSSQSPIYWELQVSGTKGKEKSCELVFLLPVYQGRGPDTRMPCQTSQ